MATEGVLLHDGGQCVAAANYSNTAALGGNGGSGQFLAVAKPATTNRTVALAAATGVASRRIAWVLAPMLVLTAFQPTLIGILAIMPPPVMASALVFTAVFIMIGGIQIISTRVLDPRRTLVIGAGLMAQAEILARAIPVRKLTMHARLSARGVAYWRR